MIWMKFEEKLIALRKRRGMSQEELAEKLQVTRQAVSRWESGATIPDVTNLIQLSELFGVTTDYLIKEEAETTTEQSAKTEMPESKQVTTHSYNFRKTMLYRRTMWVFASMCLGNIFLLLVSPSAIFVGLAAGTAIFFVISLFLYTITK